MDRIEREREFGTLLAEEKDRVFNLFFRLTGDRHVSEDLFQETFLRVYKGIDRFEGRAARSTWTSAIALNVFRDHLRRKKRRDEVIVSGLPYETLAGEPPPPGAPRARGTTGEPPSGRAGAPRSAPVPQPEDALIAAEERRELQQALNGLKESLRVPVVLHYVENLSVREIAGATGRTESDIKVSLHRARKILKKRLEDER